MTTDPSEEASNTCLKDCESKFIHFTARKPVGGAEALRLCREGCSGNPLPQDQPAHRSPG